MPKWIAVAASLSLAACGASSSPPPQMDNPTPVQPAPPSVAPPGAVDVAPQSSGNADYDAGVQALAAGNVDEAKSIQKRMRAKDPKGGEQLVLLGLIDEKTGDKAGAEKAYRDAIQTRPDLEAAYVDLSALLSDAGRYDDSVTAARAGLAKLPQSSSLHANAAQALAAKGDAAGASQEFDAAIKAAPSDPMLLMTYGHWLGVWKQTDAALAKLRAARPMARDVGMLAAIGDEMRAIGAFSDCVPTLDKAIGMKDGAELRTYRALCKLGAKDDAGALADLKAAVAADGAFGPAHYYLAGRLGQSGDLKGAISEYEAYVKIEPNGPMAKTARERIKKAKEHLKP
jgi:Tfp pilus assembly protein PilF